MTADQTAPLAGIRVLDLSTVVAGPFGSEILASLGAEVIRIDAPRPEKRKPAAPDAPVTDEDGFYYALQRNKASVALDLKSAEGKAAFLHLVAGADVVYDNFRPGVLARLGIDHAALSRINRTIVCCSISGFGSTGPWAEVGAYDVAVQALGGSMSITGTGEPGSMPCRWGVPIGDVTGAFYAVIGVLAALRERARTGRGQQIEVALLDGQLALNTYRVPQAFGAAIEFDMPSPRRGGAGTVPYGPFRCGDGAWIVIGVASNFWKAFCGVIADPRVGDDARFAKLKDRQANHAALDALLEEVFLSRTAGQWQDVLAAAGVPVGKVNTIREAFAQPQAEARGMTSHVEAADGRRVAVASSPIRFVGEQPAPQRAPVARGADNGRLLAEAPPARSLPAPAGDDSAAAALAKQDGPLGGILVLELCGDEPSGTFGTQMLADLGATVVKVERAPADEPAATALAPGAKIPADIAYFFGLNRNKLSLSIDLKQPDGRDLFLRLAARADVVYDNYKAGVMERLGIDAATLRVQNPRLVCCSVSGFGKTGPWAQLPAYDATIQALGGGMSFTGTGEPGSPPVRWGNPVGGIGGAFYAVIGILAALHRRERTGAGATLDIALLDAQLAMHGYRVPPALSGRAYAAEPRRGGSGALPYGPFLAGDGRWFVLGITGQFWPKAASVLGHPEWTADPRFATEADRQTNEVELNRLVGEAMRGADADAWQRRFVEAGIPGAKVQSIREAYDHPHVALRDMLVSFHHPVGGGLKVAGNPLKLSAHPHRGFAPAPGLGADTPRLLTRLAGLSEAETEVLRARRIAWWPREGEVYARPSVV